MSVITGYLGELNNWQDGSTICQKVHENGVDVVKKFDGRGILLLRNPYKAILSYHNFLFGGHKLYAPITNYRRKDWPTFVHLQTKLWLETVINWVSNCENLLIVHFELLKKDPLKEIKRILNYFNIQPNEDRLNCIKALLNEDFKRPRQYFPQDLEIFSPKTKDKLDRAIRYSSYLLVKYGHQPLPQDIYEFYDGAHSKIKLVKCLPEESNFDCDERVNEMNEHRLNTSNFEDLTVGMYSKMLKTVGANPLEAMMKDTEHVKKVFANPIDFDSQYGQELKTLKRDFNSGELNSTNHM